MFVIDASIAMAWCFEDEARESTDAVLDRLGQEHAAVPAIWPLEIANVLLVAERRGRINEAQASRFVELLMQLPISVDQAQVDFDALLATGRRHALSAYDASYLLLAERRGAALATLDQHLTSAARQAGVPMLVSR